MSGFGAFTSDDSINLLPEVAKLVNNKLISFDHLSTLSLFHSVFRADLWPFCCTSLCSHHSPHPPFTHFCSMLADYAQCLLNIDRNCLWINKWFVFQLAFQLLHFWISVRKLDSRDRKLFLQMQGSSCSVFSPLRAFWLHG